MRTLIGPTRRLSWFIAVSIAVVAVLVVWLAVDTAQGIAIHHKERHGMVTVSQCGFLSFGRHVNSYSCVGEFTSDAGDLRVPRVSFTHTGRLDQGELVAGTVSGPDDDTASIDSEFAVGWRLVFIAAGLATLVVLLLRLLRLRQRVAGEDR